MFIGKNKTDEQIFSKKRMLIILIFFWLLVGITSGLLYDLEWFIQHVVLFNGNLKHDLGHGDLKNIHSTKEFYKAFHLARDNGLNSHSSKIIEYYDDNIKDNMVNEGILFSAGALLAAMVSGPILMVGITKKKWYGIFVMPVLLLFSIASAFIFPVLSSLLLLWLVMTPIFGIGYSYRNTIDPWAATLSRKSGNKIVFVRAFYEIGAGIMALVVTQIYFHFGFYQKELDWSTSIAFYILAAFMVILVLFIFLFIPDKERMFSINDTLQEDERTKKNSNMGTFKVIKSKQFIIGLIIFFVIIGTTLAFSSIWVNTTENISKQNNDLGSVRYIGYMKASSIIPRFLIAVFILKILNKVSIKTMLIITAPIAVVTWSTLGLLIYVIGDSIPMWSVSIIGGVGEAIIASFGVLLALEWVSIITTPKNRGPVFMIFNAAAYGLGAIVFTGFNTFLSKTSLFGYEGLLVWFIMAVSSLVALVLIIVLFKSPKKAIHEDLNKLDEVRQRTMEIEVGVENNDNEKISRQ